MPSVPWRVESSKIFKKNQKSFKFPKMPKIVPKSIQTCFERALGQTFEKILPSFPWKVESSKIFKKIKKVSNFLKYPKSFPKVSKRVLNVFWGNFFLKNFMPSVPWREESSKIFKNIYLQNYKNAQNCSQKYPNVF